MYRNISCIVIPISILAFPFWIASPSNIFKPEGLYIPKPTLKTKGIKMVLLPGYKWLEVVHDRRGGRSTVKAIRVAVVDILEMLVAGWGLGGLLRSLRYHWRLYMRH